MAHFFFSVPVVKFQQVCNLLYLHLKLVCAPSKYICGFKDLLSYMPFTCQYMKVSFTFMFCSKKIVWSWKRPQKFILRGLWLVRKVSSGFWLSSFPFCTFFHPLWFLQAVQVFGPWRLDWRVMLPFNKHISPLENDSQCSAFASYSTNLANKTPGSALLFGHAWRATCWDRISLLGQVMQTCFKSNKVPAEMLLCSPVFHLTVHPLPRGLNTHLQRRGSLCDEKVLFWFLQKSPGDAVYFGCLCLLLGQHFLYSNICSPDLKHPWLHLASMRHLIAFWCVLESTSVPKNLGTGIQLHFCLSPLSHATS